VGQRRARVQLDRAREFPLGICPVPVVEHVDERQGRVRFGQRRVQLERLAGQGLALGNASWGGTNAQTPSDPNESASPVYARAKRGSFRIACSKPRDRASCYPPERPLIRAIVRRQPVH
jgi:hypothetical protein